MSDLTSWGQGGEDCLETKVALLLYWIRTIYELNHSFIYNLNILLGGFRSLIYAKNYVSSDSTPILLTGFKSPFFFSSFFFSSSWFSYYKNPKVFLVMPTSQSSFLLPCCHSQLIQSTINHPFIYHHSNHPTTQLSTHPSIYQSIHSSIHSTNIYWILIS